MKRTSSEKTHAPKGRYKKLQFQEVLYELGDYVYIRESKNTNMIGMLSRIISQEENPKYPKWPMVEVKWYYRKGDLKDGVIPYSDLKDISDSELFDTEFYTKVYADLLNGKCKVWTMEEYEEQSVQSHDDYFTRASYDIEEVVLLISMTAVYIYIYKCMRALINR